MLIECVFSRYRDSKISQIRLKMPIPATKNHVLGRFDPQTLFFIIETPKSEYLTQKHAFWAIDSRNLSSGVTCRREQVYNKGKTQKVTKNALPTQTPFSSSHVNQILHVGSYSGCLSCFWVLLKWVEKCGSCGVRNFGLSIDLAHRLYNSLLLSHKPWFNANNFVLKLTRFIFNHFSAIYYWTCVAALNREKFNKTFYSESSKSLKVNQGDELVLAPGHSCVTKVGPEVRDATTAYAYASAQKITETTRSLKICYKFNMNDINFNTVRRWTEMTHQQRVSCSGSRVIECAVDVKVHRLRSCQMRTFFSTCCNCDVTRAIFEEIIAITCVCRYSLNHF